MVILSKKLLINTHFMLHLRKKADSFHSKTMFDPKNAPKYKVFFTKMHYVFHFYHDESDYSWYTKDV